MSKINFIAPVLCVAAMALGAGSSIAVHGQTRSPAPAQPDGAALYQSRCGGCHSIATNRIGPAHRGVVGRRAGTAPGYAYSPALRNADLVWTPQNLDRWLQGPQAVVRGSRMFTSVANAAERAAIIRYLETQRN